MLRNWKKAVALVLALVLCLGVLAGCGKKEETKTETTTAAKTETTTAAKAEAGKEKIKLAFSSKNKSNPFQYETVRAFEEAIDPATTDILVADCMSDPAKQVNDIQDMIEWGADAILFVPYDSTGLQDVVRQAKEAGIIMINIDNKVDEPTAEYCDAIIVSDNFQAGQICADGLAAALGEEGEIGLYTVPTSMASVNRTEGFKARLEEKYPNIKIVTEQVAQTGTTDAALPVMENVLQTFPNLDGMFGYCGSASVGCVSAVKSAGKLDQIKVVSVDGSNDEKELIRAGELVGAAAQFPGELSRMGVELAYDLIAGGSVKEKYITMETVWIDESNVDEVDNGDY